jgi:hypothetical protein
MDETRGRGNLALSGKNIKAQHIFHGNPEGDYPDYLICEHNIKTDIKGRTGCVEGGGMD